MRAFLETISPANARRQDHQAAAGRPRATTTRACRSPSPSRSSPRCRPTGLPVWYVVAKDEGHGFQKKTNTDYMRVVLIEFMRQYLLGEGAVAAK